MKKTAKLLAVILSLVMVLSVFASCTGQKPAETTKAPATDAPATDAPATDAPATDAPATDAPATDAPATDAPATDAPATDAPATDAPATDAPATDAPETEAPETEAPETEAPETEAPETEAPETEEPETDPEDLEALLPPQISLDREMSIFVGELYDEEWLEEDDGDLVGTELYNRVLRVENLLGIELNVDLMWGDGTQKTVIMDEIAKRQESTDPNVIADLCSTYSQFAGSLTLEGRYQNIANSDEIDFDNPWWPSDLIENSVIDDKVYFVSGDISPTLLYEIYAIFYNRELIERYGMPNPIDLVNSHEWTLDKLITLTEGIYDDLDNSGTVTIGDFTALAFCDNAHIKAFPFAMGVRVLIPDEDEGYVWSESYTGEKMDTIYEKFTTWVQTNPGVTVQTELHDFGVNFRNRTNIFTVGNFGFAKGELSGSGIDYAVVPCPMYDEDQGEYFSYYGNPSSFWGLPTNADLDDSAALLEYLAADAYVYISPALFERALKLKYVTNDVDGLSRMFDIIRDGLVFDACMFYNSHITGYSQFTELANGGSNWAALFTGFKVKAMQKKVDTFVSILRELD